MSRISRLKTRQIHQLAVKVHEEPKAFYSGCNSKKRHPSKRRALGELRLMEQDPETRYNANGLRPYKCKFCQGWHLGH